MLHNKNGMRQNFRYFIQNLAESIKYSNFTVPT